MFAKNFLSKLRRLAVDRGERYYPVGSFNELDATHTTNYIFAKQFIWGKVVLDVGCGFGFGCDYLARSRSGYVVGIDISNEAVRFAKTHYKASNLDFIVMDANHLGFRDSSFDIITSFEVIEHMYNTKNYLFEMRRVLKTDGVAIISTPNKNVSSPGLRKPILPFNVKEFNPEGLYSLLSQYFKEVSILGKRLSNEEIKMKERELRRSWKFKIIVKLSQRDLIRALARLLPLKIKQTLTGSRGFHLKPSDFEISAQSVEDALTLILICRTPTRR